MWIYTYQRVNDHISVSTVTRALEQSMPWPNMSVHTCRMKSDLVMSVISVEKGLDMPAHWMDTSDMFIKMSALLCAMFVPNHSPLRELSHTTWPHTKSRIVCSVRSVASGWRMRRYFVSTKSATKGSCSPVHIVTNCQALAIICGCIWRDTVMLDHTPVPCVHMVLKLHVTWEHTWCSTLGRSHTAVHTAPKHLLVQVTSMHIGRWSMRFLLCLMSDHYIAIIKASVTVLPHLGIEPWTCLAFTCGAVMAW